MPGYVKFYLSELKRHFTEVLFLANEKSVSPDDIQFLSSNNIPYRLYKNEGFDFGMWYKAFQEYDIKKYDRVGLVNDSCILFNKLDFFFDWLEKSNMDYCGMTDCNEIKYHIQSYFIIISKKAIPLIQEYFKQHGIVSDMKQLINIYEVGISTYLVNAGMKIAAYYSFKDETGVLNPSLMKAKDLIKAGYPLVKKRILTRSCSDPTLIKFGLDLDPRKYVRLINKTCPEGNINNLTSGVLTNLGWRKEIQFYSQIYFDKAYFFIFHKVRALRQSIRWMLSKN